MKCSWSKLKLSVTSSVTNHWSGHLSRQTVSTQHFTPRQFTNETFELLLSSSSLTPSSSVSCWSSSSKLEVSDAVNKMVCAIFWNIMQKIASHPGPWTARISWTLDPCVVFCWASHLPHLITPVSRIYSGILEQILYLRVSPGLDEGGSDLFIILHTVEPPAVRSRVP